MADNHGGKLYDKGPKSLSPQKIDLGDHCTAERCWINYSSVYTRTEAIGHLLEGFYFGEWKTLAFFPTYNAPFKMDWSSRKMEISLGKVEFVLKEANKDIKSTSEYTSKQDVEAQTTEVTVMRLNTDGSKTEAVVKSDKAEVKLDELTAAENALNASKTTLDGAESELTTALQESYGERTTAALDWVKENVSTLEDHGSEFKDVATLLESTATSIKNGALKVENGANSERTAALTMDD